MREGDVQYVDDVIMSSNAEVTHSNIKPTYVELKCLFVHT